MQITTIKIGILGFGTVGAGVAELLLKNGNVISRRIGVDVQLHKIADLDIFSDRGVKIPEGILTTQVDEVFESCDVIIELIGGKTVARSFITHALQLGKTVITANKALLAEYGVELFEIAEKNHCNIFYEASVGGGIPIIKAVREALAGNRFKSIYAILNGTCNYILTEMLAKNLTLQAALNEAQAKGYAESDPSFDIDGIDTAHKTAILASLAYGEWFGTKNMHIEGIANLDVADLHYAKEMGYKIKLLGVMRQIEDDVEFRVHPALIPTTKTLANVDGVYNAICVTGDYVGETLFSGRGAGREATASAVVSDIIDAALDIKTHSQRRVPSFRKGAQFKDLIPMSNIITRHYIRMQCTDRIGAYAKITRIFSEHSISISAISQRESCDEHVNVIIMTHLAKEGDVVNAMNELDAMTDTIEKMIRIRIEA